MANNDIKQILSDAMDIYATLVLVTGNKEKLMEKGAAEDMFEVENMSQQRLREAILKTGEILDEDPNTGVITAVLPTGNMNASRALVVAQHEGNTVHVAAFFKEGLIKQHGARQAIDAIRRQLKKKV